VSCWLRYFEIHYFFPILGAVLKEKYFTNFPTFQMIMFEATAIKKFRLANLPHPVGLGLKVFVL